MPETLEQRCIERDIKMTGQRRIIAQVIEESTDHPDVEEVYLRASKKDAKISIATVYRTVKLLEENNLIEKHDFGEGKARYETISEEHHDHLIDIRSGKVIEFVNEEIERIQEEVAKNLGYKIVDHRLELYCIPIDGKE